MAPIEKIAMRIKAERAKRNWTQAKLGYLARLETGRQDPTITTIEKLAKALKVPVGRLLK